MKDYEQLFQNQISEWPLAAANYKDLSKVLIRDYNIDGIRIRLQCNPSRIKSSTANTSAKVIQKRPCFLCEENRPKEQTGVPFKPFINRSNGNNAENDFTILVNPYPIFGEHFTIPSKHSQQKIKGNFDILLELARHMDNCITFYNGPRCGASAPDHMHFQAGNRDLLPVQADYNLWRNSNTKLISGNEEASLYMLKDFLRGGWFFEGHSQEKISGIFYSILEQLESVNPESDQEPMINVLCWFENGKWICMVFPRKTHRPSCYYLEGDDKLLISPASVEMGGLMVAAIPEDFEKISEKEIIEIYKDVSFSDEDVNLISEKLKLSI